MKYILKKNLQTLLRNFHKCFISNQIFCYIHCVTPKRVASLRSPYAQDSPNKLYLPKHMGEDQLDDLEQDGPITLRILDGTAWDFIEAKWWRWWKTVRCDGLISSCWPRKPQEKAGNEERRKKEEDIRVIVSGNTASFEEMLQRLRVVGNSIVSYLTSPRFEPQNSCSRDEYVTARPIGIYTKSLGLDKMSVCYICIIR